MTSSELARRMEQEWLNNVRLIQKILFALEGNSTRRTPVDTGTLRRSITNKIFQSGLRGQVGSNVLYGPFVHDGTRYMEARPFFIWGLELSRGQINKILAEEGRDLFARWSR